MGLMKKFYIIIFSSLLLIFYFFEGYSQDIEKTITVKELGSRLN